MHFHSLTFRHHAFSQVRATALLFRASASNLMIFSFFVSEVLMKLAHGPKHASWPFQGKGPIVMPGVFSCQQSLYVLTGIQETRSVSESLLWAGVEKTPAKAFCVSASSWAGVEKLRRKPFMLKLRRSPSWQQGVEELSVAEKRRPFLKKLHLNSQADISWHESGLFWAGCRS